MSFRAVFIAIVIAFALILGALIIHGQRPAVELKQPGAEYVAATGKCAECHDRQQRSIVHEYERSVHASKGVNCLDCHAAAEGQKTTAHHGFEISAPVLGEDGSVVSPAVTAANCKACHTQQYQQFLRSRHAAPAWAAVHGASPFSSGQLERAESWHPGAVKRPPNPLVALEGASAAAAGCDGCHSLGKPNPDGTIGTCTACHSRHTASVELARLPTTCGQCHMGPDHSQLEIYEESKHGVMFAAQRDAMRLDTPASELTTREQFVPTCSTCHMSGINGLGTTHDTTERLSWHLASAVSGKRRGYAAGQTAMKEVCAQCHTPAIVDRVYTRAEQVVEQTNAKVGAAQAIVDALRHDGLIEGPPFSNEVDFVYFDLWHYYGRTSKHGAFMGGSDFAQWHGNYPLLEHTVQLQSMADALRRERADGE